MPVGWATAESGGGLAIGTGCLVKQSVAVLSGWGDSPRRAEAVGDALRQPAGYAEGLGELPGMEGLWQHRREEMAKVGGGTEAMDFSQLDEPLVFHLVIPFSAASAPSVAGITPLLDIHQGHIQGQPWMGKDAGEVDEVLEDVQESAVFGAEPSANHRSVAESASDEEFFHHDRLDHEDLVVLEQPAHFVANGRKGTMLDFHELPSGNGIDAVFSQAHFVAGVITSIEELQVAME